MTRTLRMERLVPAARERVWRAWTTPDGLAGWWWPHLPGTTYEIDARIGGTYRITSPVAGIGVHGTYLALDEPARIEATWIWVDDGTDGDTEHLVVTFAPHPSGTTLTIEHSGAWLTDEPARAYEQGWTDTLAVLARTRS